MPITSPPARQRAAGVRRAPSRTTGSQMNRLKSATALGGLVLAAAAALPALAQDQALIDAAKAEGTLTTIALPHDWCNYGGVIEGFKAKYGLEVNELNPDAGSADELEAIRANKD